MKKLIVLLIVTLMLTACSGMTTLQTENNKVREVPTWYVDHGDTGKEGWIFGDRTEYMYSVAEDVSPSMEMAVRKATLKAKAKLADKVTGELYNRTIYKYTETGTPEQPTGNALSQDIIVNKISETVLKYYEVDKRTIVYSPNMRNYHVYVLVKITKARLDEAASNYATRKSIAASAQTKVTDQTFNDIAEEVVTQ